MGLKEALREMAAERNGPTVPVPLLNDPTKQIAIPVSYQEQILEQYGLKLGDLVGQAPFYAVFVREGIVFGMTSKDGERGRITLHGVDLRPGEDKNIEMVGSEVYETWKSIPREQLMLYEQLQRNVSTLYKRLPRTN